MSEDTTKTDLEDFIEQYQVKIQEAKTSMQGAFQQLNLFYSKKSGSDKIYQYEQENQKEFMTQQQIISASLESVYPVVRDINETFKITQLGVTQQPMMQQQSPVNINVSPQQPQQKRQGFWQRFFGTEQSTIPTSLEDAWNMTKEWTVTTMNFPNLWQKLLDFHHKGKIRYEVLPDGMEKYLSLEVWYLNTIIEPLITRMVQRGLVLMEEKSMDSINKAYGITLAHEEKMESMKMFQQQMGGGHGKTEPNP